MFRKLRASEVTHYRDLVVVLSTANGVTHCAKHPQHQSDEQDNDAERPQNADLQNSANNEKN
jgi:hypothetical protein